MLAELESQTNPRLRQEVGDLSLVPVADRIVGTGASPVMAAFTHIGFPSRFTDGTFGVYYAAAALETAIVETVFHFEEFLRSTNEERAVHEMRAYVGKINCELHDVREGYPSLHDAASYRESQAFAQRIREKQSSGLIYNSVRHARGQCIAAFRPRVIGAVMQGPHLRYQWSGERIERFIRIGDENWRPVSELQS